MSGAGGRGSSGLRPQWPVAADLLGKPELGAVPRGHAAADVRRRSPTRGLLRDQRVRVYSGCRQYRENLYDAARAVGDRAPALDRLRHYFNHPGFVQAFADTTCSALQTLAEPGDPDTRLVFVTHSVPLSMAQTSGPTGGAYERQHRDAAAQIAAAVAARTGTRRDWDLVSARARVRLTRRGWSRMSTTTSSGSRSGRSPRSSWFPSASSPTTWRLPTTSTPRPRPPRDDSGCRSSARVLRALTPPSSRWSATSSPRDRPPNAAVNPAGRRSAGRARAGTAVQSPAVRTLARRVRRWEVRHDHAVVLVTGRAARAGGGDRRGGRSAGHGGAAPPGRGRGDQEQPDRHRDDHGHRRGAADPLADPCRTRGRRHPRRGGR